MARKGEWVKKMHKKITILGAGSFGTAMSMVLLDSGHDILLYTREESQLKEIMETGKNEKYIKGVDIPKEINITTDLEKAVKFADILIIAIPTQNVRGLLESVKPFVKEDQIVVNLAKGLEIGTNYRVSQIYSEVIGLNNFVCLSGPSHAEELAIKMPSTVVCCSENQAFSHEVQNLLSNKYLRIYTNSDLIGVEIGAALKNIIALSSGIVEGMKFGDNTKAALITRGLHEITRFGVKLGADRLTFSGLTGVGDLIVTCTSMNSRNLRFGILLGQGEKIEKALEKIGMVVEGMTTCKAAYEMSNKLGISMPITTNLYKVLYENQDIEIAVNNLMNRQKKSELKFYDNEEEIF